MAEKRLQGVQLPLVDDIEPYDLPQSDEPANGNGQKLRGQNQSQMTKNRTLNVDDLIRAADQLSEDELRQLQAAIAALLQVKDLGNNDEAQIPRNRTLSSGKAQRGSIEKKKINGCGPYRYLRWWSNGKHKSTYLGKDKEDEG